MMPSTAEERTRGWIKLHRKVLDKAWLASPKLWAFWSWCLLRASRNNRTIILDHQVVHLAPGQLLFGRKKAAQALRQSEQSIRTHLKFLARVERSITIQTTNKYSIITIVNWQTYQAGGVEDGHQANQPFTSNSPTVGHKQEWSNNEKKKELSLVSEDQLSQFNLFYEAYPVKKGGQSAMKAFAKLNPQNGTFETILTALEAQKAQHDRMKAAGQWVPEWPYPATWLNKRRWEDEVQTQGTIDEETMSPIEAYKKREGLA